METLYEKINKELGTNFKFYRDIKWDKISSKFRLSEQFIENYKDKVDWTAISCYQILSEEFIEKFQDKVHWGFIFSSQNLSKDFIKKWEFKISSFSNFEKELTKYSNIYINL